MQRHIRSDDVPWLVDQELSYYAECARCMGMLHLKRFDDHIPKDELSEACSFNSYLFSNKIAFANWDAAREYWTEHYRKLVGRKDVTITGQGTATVWPRRNVRTP